MHSRIAPIFLVLMAFGIAPAEAKDCTLVCAPSLKLEPALSISNLFGGAAIAHVNGDSGGSVSREPREMEFEIIVALNVPTEIPRLGVTLEASWKPFGAGDINPFTGRTAEELGVESVRDNAVELELEANLTLLEPEQTGGWVDMHFDIVDQFSPAGRPNDRSAYTHKLNLELDTAFRLFQSLPDEDWLRNVEVEVSLDYLATGTPRAGDQFPDGIRYLEDASPWSLSLVLVLPIAPLFP